MRLKIRPITINASDGSCKVQVYQKPMKGFIKDAAVTAKNDVNYVQGASSYELYEQAVKHNKHLI